jgi:hypothetical protein
MERRRNLCIEGNNNCRALQPSIDAVRCKNDDEQPHAVALTAATPTLVRVVSLCLSFSLRLYSSHMQLVQQGAIPASSVVHPHYW